MNNNYEIVKICLQCKKRPRLHNDSRTLLCDNCYKKQKIPIQRSLKDTSSTKTTKYTIKASPDTDNRLLTN